MEKISKLLALETTDVSGSVALCEDGLVLESRSLCSGRRSAQSLAPTIQTLLKDHEWKPSDVDAVAVAVGPGSFTGLRVGVATGKMFAWAVNAKIISVDALDAVVATLIRSGSFMFEVPTVLSVGIDAQRGDAAVRYYFVVPETEKGTVASISLDERFHVVAIKEWLGADGEASFQDVVSEESRAELERSLTKLSAGQIAALRAIKAKDVAYAGPALRRVRDLTAKYPAIKLVPDGLWNPDASGVAFVAWQKVVDNSLDDVWTVLPVYSRRAAAEEKALAEQKVLAEARKTNASS